MATRRRVGPAKAGSESEVLEEENGREAGERGLWSVLREDGGSLSVLLVLYTLQGVPMGLSGAIPLLLAGKAAYRSQALFSLASVPFSVKLLWAPIVDSTAFGRFGRRKSWLVPTQALIGAAMVASQGRLDAWMLEANASALTALFFGLYFLCATQDVAVDGWALTMLSPANVGWGPACNSLGQSLGYAASYVGFVALHESGKLSLARFVGLCGWTFLATTLLVALFKPEGAAADAESPTAAYRLALDTLRLRPVRRLCLVLLTCRLGFGAADAATAIKAVEAGLPRESMALLSPALLAASVAFPVLCSRWTTGSRPLDAFVAAVPLRLSLNLATWAVLALVERDPLSTRAFTAFALLALAREFAANLMFVAQMAFFAVVADPRFGGTYMTLLNTVANLGAKWPPSLSLYLLDLAGDRPPFDPFALQLLLATLLGFLWLALFRDPIATLQALPLKAWRLAHPALNGDAPHADPSSRP